MNAIRQLGWSSIRRGMRWSAAPYHRRFSILLTTTLPEQRVRGYLVTDHQTGETTRLSTFAGAKAWAGIRVGERDVRHGH